MKTTTKTTALVFNDEGTKACIVKDKEIIKEFNLGDWNKNNKLNK